MFTRKVRLWYWQTFKVLLFCVFLLRVSRFFMKIVMINDNSELNFRSSKKQKKRTPEPLFV
ncbi:MAG: hypothetical protein PVI26_03405 [Chitinispirillia bacterium]|jgi:hypothetical protein